MADVYLTQKELSIRWRKAQSTIINWRKAGRLPYFQPLGSKTILYPVDKIEEMEQEHTKVPEEVPPTKKTEPEKRKKPVVSAPKRDWRI